MGIDMMKTNGARCPPILIGGLIIMCIYLLCSRWSLTSQTAELLKQIDNLVEQLKINGEELGKCFQQTNLLNEKLKDSQKQFMQKQVEADRLKDVEKQMNANYERLMSDAEDHNKKIMECERNVKLCKAETDSLKKLMQSKETASKTLRSENQSLQSEILQKDNEIKELGNKLKNINKTNEVPSLSKFKEYLQGDGSLSKTKKNHPDNESVNKVNRDVQEQYAEEQKEDKVEGEAKNYGDPGILLLYNDPREAEMKGP